MSLGKIEVSKTYGQKIRVAREAMGLSQVQLAQRMGYLGEKVMAGQNLVSKIELGKGPRGPAMPTRKLLGEALGLDVEGNPLKPPPPPTEPVVLHAERFVEREAPELPVFAFVAAGDAAGTRQRGGCPRVDVRVAPGGRSEGIKRGGYYGVGQRPRRGRCP